MDKVENIIVALFEKENINNVDKLIFYLTMINKKHNLVSLQKLLKELKNKCNMDIKEIEKIKKKFKENLSNMNNNIINISKSNKNIEIKTKEEEIKIETNNISQNLEMMEKEISVLKEQINKLEKEVFYDVFLNIYNRKKLIEDFNNIYKNKEMYICVIDIDNFKQINDTYGHLIGDKILLKFIRILTKYIEQEHIYRYGGDEFVLFIDKNININKIFDKIKDEFEKKKFKIIINNKEDYIKISFSSGIYLKKKDENNLSDILEKADIALYESKKTGKNKYTLFK